MPAAAVIPSSLGNFEVDVVKKFVADLGHWPRRYVRKDVMTKPLLHFAKEVLRQRRLLLAIAYHEEN